MPSFALFDRLQAKLEFLRLEKRYTRTRRRRSTFVSNAVYVDGEYVYQTPVATGSSADSSPVDASSDVERPDVDLVDAAKAAKKKKRASIMPGFGSDSPSWRS